ncbi:MAG: hypothetical protein QOJ99_5286 [Bryobacterales bacterium]|nr:hypothetical protein [Bryobacterales bacterium]
MHYDAILEFLLAEVEATREEFKAECAAISALDSVSEGARPKADAFQKALQRHWKFTQEGIAPAEFADYEVRHSLTTFVPSRCELIQTV